MKVAKLSKLPKTTRRHYTDNGKIIFGTHVNINETMLIIVDKKIEVDTNWKMIFLGLKGEEISWDKILEHKVFIVTERHTKDGEKIPF